MDMEWRMRMKKWVVVFLAGLSGCSSQVALKPEKLVRQQTVSIKLQSGQSVTGEVEAVDADGVVVIDQKGQAWRARRNQIADLKGPLPVFDGDNRIISEKEISQYKTNHNAVLFTISGGLLSMGTSFFLSSMLSRVAGDEQRDAIILGGTAAGTAAGAILFHRMGARKDRDTAIREIKYNRALEKGAGDVTKPQDQKIKIDSELDQIRRERAKQDAEIERLKSKIKENQKK
jgi:hypothetical protein